MKWSRKQISLTILVLVLMLPILLYQILLSSTVIRIVWLPIASKASGYQLTAEECSVSLFGKKTLEIRGGSGKGKGVNASLQELSLEMNPFSVLFSNALEILDLKINGLHVEYRVPLKTISSEKKVSSLPKKNKESMPSQSLALRITSVVLSNSRFTLIDEWENRIHAENLQFTLADFMQGKKSVLRWSLQLSADGNFKLQPASLQGNLNLLFPEDSFRPLAVHGTLDIQKILLSGKDFTLPTLNGVIRMDASRKGDVCSLKNALFRISGEKKVLFDLSAAGIYDPASPYSNHLDLISTEVDVWKIQEIFMLITKSKKQKEKKTVAVAEHTSSSRLQGKASPVPSPEEPKTLDLSRYNGKINLDFKKITYTPDAVISVFGPVKIVANAITLDDLKIKLNESPLNLRFSLNTGYSGGYAYSGALSMKNLNLPPLLKAFCKGEDSGVTGTVPSLNLNFQGKGVTPSVWKKNLKGDLTAKISGLSFPALSADMIQSLNVVLIPLRAIPGISNALSGNSLSADWNLLIGNMGSVLNGEKNVELKNGFVDLSVAQGVVFLKQIQFQGGTLPGESVNGQINLLTNQIALNAEVNTGILVIPMSVSGTLSDPKPDYRKFLQNFAQNNLQRLLNPQKIEKTIQKVDGLINQKNLDKTIQKVDGLLNLFQ